MSTPQYPDGSNGSSGGYPGGNPGPDDPGSWNTGQTGGGYQPYGAGSPGQDGYPGGYQSGYPGDYQGGYAPGGWGGEQKNSIAFWALGVAIASLVLMFSIILSFFAPLLGLVGLILSIIAIVKARKITGAGRRMAVSVVALVLSVIAMIIPVVLLVFSFAFLEDTGIVECMNLSSSTAQEQCVNDKLGLDELE